MKKKTLLRILLVLLMCTMLVTTIIYKNKFMNYYCVDSLDITDIDELNLDNYDKLMIVAHPDDETIWGGAHLVASNYLVVCVTNGRNSVRKNEFFNAISHSDDKGLILEYPDKTFGKRDTWDYVYDDIKDDLDKIINYKEWTLVVTHNPDGEYGHIHHKMTSAIVTDIMKTETKNGLYYFGKYYTAKKISGVKDKLDTVDEKYLKIKRDEMIPEYKSQQKVTQGLSHMFPYENWYEADLR